MKGATDPQDPTYEAPEVGVSRRSGPDRAAWRRYVAIALVVATSIAGLGAVVGVWTNRTLFDADRFMGVVSPTLEDPLFYERLADYAGEELLDVLALEERFTERLRNIDEVLAGLVVEAVEPGELLDWLLTQIDLPTFASLAPTLAAEVEDRVVDASTTVLTSEPVTVLVLGLVERAHVGLVALALEEPNQIPNVYVASGEVRYNLLPYIAQAMGLVAGEIGELLPEISLPPLVSDRADQALNEFRDALGRRVPDDFGQVRIMSVEQLESVQTGAGRLRALAWAWLGVTIALAVATFLASTNRLRTALQLSIGFGIALIVGVFVISVFEGVVLNALGTRDGELISGFVTDTFGRLRLVLLLFVLAAGAVALLSYLAREVRWRGPTRATPERSSG